MMMFKLWQKLCKCFTGINNVFDDDNLPSIKIHIQSYGCYHLPVDLTPL